MEPGFLTECHACGHYWVIYDNAIQLEELELGEGYVLPKGKTACCAACGFEHGPGVEMKVVEK